MRLGGEGALVVGYRWSCPSASRGGQPFPLSVWSHVLNFAADPVRVRRLFRARGDIAPPPKLRCAIPRAKVGSMSIVSVAEASRLTLKFTAVFFSGSLALAVSTATASAQTNDLTLRAAYCVGVLAEQLAANAAQPPRFASICAQWQSKGFASEGACVAETQRFMLADLRGQLDRYRQYLRVQSLTMSPGATAQVAILKNKGLLDTRAYRARDPSPQEVGCFNGCAGGGGWESCIERCMDMDPTVANIRRCGSDVLPF